MILYYLHIMKLEKEIMKTNNLEMWHIRRMEFPDGPTYDLHIELTRVDVSASHYFLVGYGNSPVEDIVLVIPNHLVVFAQRAELNSIRIGEIENTIV